MLAMVGLSACLKVDKFPDKPELTSIDFQVQPDSSGILTVGFTDGDGDIGTDDTTRKSLFVRYFEWRDGKWVFAGNETTFFFLKRIEPEGRVKSLEGELEVALKPTYYNPITPYDTLKYTVQLIDRAGNESNVVETAPILKP